MGDAQSLIFVFTLTFDFNSDITHKKLGKVLNRACHIYMSHAATNMPTWQYCLTTLALANKVRAIILMASKLTVT